MQTTDYEKQAQDFLDRFQIKFRATLSDSKVAPWQGRYNNGHHYRVTLSGGYVAHPRRLTFDFWGSIADAEKLVQANKDLQNMQLQMQNTEPHLRINLRDLLQEAEQTVTNLHPSPYDVLACISSDIHCPETFEDFCAEFGDSKDSIKALQTFRRCSAFAKRLRSFFTKEEME